MLLTESPTKTQPDSCDAAFSENLEHWFSIRGDIDDFIFYEAGEKPCSEK